MDFSVKGTAELANAYSRSQQQNLSRLENKLQKDTGDEEKLKKACKDFEGLLIEQMFKSMRETVPKSDFLGDRQEEDLFTEMLDTERAKSFAAEGGLGMWKALYEQLRQQLPANGSRLPAAGSQDQGSGGSEKGQST